MCVVVVIKEKGGDGGGGACYPCVVIQPNSVLLIACFGELV